MSVKVEDKLFLDRFRVDEDPHIRIRDGAVCLDRCLEQPCLYICPPTYTGWRKIASAWPMKGVWSAALAA